MLVQLNNEGEPEQREISSVVYLHLVEFCLFYPKHL